MSVWGSPVLLGGGKAFTALEKAVFSGGQYFFLRNLPANSKVRAVVSVANTSSAAKAVIGYRGADTAASDFDIYFENSTLTYFARNSGYLSPSGVTYPISANTKYTLEFTLLTSRAAVHVGRYSGSSGGEFYFIGSLYELTVSDAGDRDLIHLIPGREELFNEVFFYDTVSGSAYRNLGSTALSAG